MGGKITTILISSGTAICGFVGGMIFMKHYVNKHTSYGGTIRIDRSEASESPKLFLELEESIQTLSNSNDVIFRVVDKNYIS